MPVVQLPPVSVPSTVVEQKKTPKKKEKPLFSLSDAAKVGKTTRAVAKFCELVTDIKIPQPVKTLLKSTKAIKPLRAPLKALSIPKQVSRLREATTVQKESIVLMKTVRVARSAAAGIVTGFSLLDDLGIQSSFLPPVITSTFKAVNPVLKPASIMLAMKSMKKAHGLRSSLKTLSNEISTAPLEEKSKVAASAVTKLIELNPKRLQKKLGLRKEVPLEKQIGELKQEPTSDPAKVNKLLQTLTFQAGISLGCKTLRTASKIGILTGRVLIATGIAPTVGHVMVYSSVFTAFGVWVAQKKYL